MAIITCDRGSQFHTHRFSLYVSMGDGGVLYLDGRNYPRSATRCFWLWYTIFTGGLETPPLVWIGHRSYGIYLWHWPLHVIGFYHSPMAAVPTALIVLMLSIALADVSYRYIETPIRTHGFLGWLRTMPPLHKKKAAGIVLAALVTGTAVAGFITEHATSSGQQLIIDAEKQAKEQQSTPAPPPLSEPRDTPENPKRPVLPNVVGENVTVIGDSVTVAATPALQEKLPGIVVNSEVSRSIKQFPTIAAQMAQENQLRPYVVIALGTNGAITEEDAQAILNAVGPDRRIVLVTASAPEYATWVPVSNSTMREMARKNPDRVVIADWQSIALAHPDLLAGIRFTRELKEVRCLLMKSFRLYTGFRSKLKIQGEIQVNYFPNYWYAVMAACRLS